jgi:hypothetical protein
VGLADRNQRATELAEGFAVYLGRYGAHGSALACPGKQFDAVHSVPSLYVCADRPVSIPMLPPQAAGRGEEG